MKTMTFPALSNEFLLQRLQFPTKKVRMVLDLDTYNVTMTSLPWCTRCSAPKS